MLPSWATETITVVRPSWRDERGKQVPDYDTPAARTVVEGCEVQSGASTEDLGARQNVIIRHTVWAPAGTVVGARDAVEFEGTRYAVDGEPMRWRSPTGALSHVQIFLIDWEG
ncbi:MAG: hypothetical protein ACO1ON_12845 [Nocardioides sp.]